MARPLKPILSTAMLAVCASFACQAAERSAPAAQEASTDSAAGKAPATGPGIEGRLDWRRASTPATGTPEISDRESWAKRYVAAAATEQESRPAAPPFRYQYVGRMEVEGRLTVHLAKDDKLYPVRIGDTLDGTFRVENIKSDGLELTYLPLKRKQFVAFSTIAPPTPREARAVGRSQAPQQPMASSPPAEPVSQPVPGLTPSRGDGVAASPGADMPGAGVPVGGLPSTLPGSPGAPGAPAPSMSTAPVAPPGTPAGQPATGTAAMPVSPPGTEMPVGPPTVSTMPTLPPGTDLPDSPPSGETMATTPPSGGM
jgi:hypothetical protein